MECLYLLCQIGCPFYFEILAKFVKGFGYKFALQHCFSPSNKQIVEKYYLDFKRHVKVLCVAIQRELGFTLVVSRVLL